MPFAPNLKIGQVIDNKDLCAIFRCSPQGGMRRSHATNTLVLVSSHVRGIYHDRWERDVLHYTGMGQEGDQSRTAGQNGTLDKSNVNGVDLFLFEVFKRGEYTFSGRVVLAQDYPPFQELQDDVKGNARKVWVFPVRTAGQGPYVPQEAVLDRLEEARARAVNAMTDGELRARAQSVQTRPGSRLVTSLHRERSPLIAEYARRRAKGVCDLCKNPAPFLSRKGEPYLECHHIVWLARGGPDSTENTVALCPNCHRRMHQLDAAEDREALLALNAARP